MSEVLWSPKQKDFFRNAKASYNICSGSVSSGKTYIANMRFLYNIYTAPPGSLLALIGRTTESLKDNVIRYLMMADEGISLEDTKVPMRLKCRSNNVEVTCAGGENERAWQRVQGKTTAGAMFDEVTTLPQTLVQAVCKGCRHEGKQWPKLFTTNPDHPTHWFKKGYMDNPKFDKKLWYFGLGDNPSLTPEYVEETKALYTGVAYERFIEGKWVQAEGVIYREFNRDLNTFDVKPDKYEEYVLGIDWGDTNPLAILLYGIDYDGNYDQLDEICVRHQLINDKLKDMMVDKGWYDLKYGERKQDISYAYCDTNRPDLLRQFKDVTGITTIPAYKNVLDGIHLVHNYFARRKLRIHSSCIHTLNEVDGYVWKEGKDEPVKKDDHCMDAKRYVIFTREKGRVRVFNKANLNV